MTDNGGAGPGARFEEAVAEITEAARVSDRTAFMYLGELVEFDETEKIFTKPSKRQTEDYISGRFG